MAAGDGGQWRIGRDDGANHNLLALTSAVFDSSLAIREPTLSPNGCNNMFASACFRSLAAV